MPPKKRKEPNISLNFCQAELNDDIMNYLLRDSDDDYDTCDDGSSDGEDSESSTKTDSECGDSDLELGCQSEVQDNDNVIVAEPVQCDFPLVVDDHDVDVDQSGDGDDEGETLMTQSEELDPAVDINVVDDDDFNHVDVGDKAPIVSSTNVSRRVRPRMDIETSTAVPQVLQTNHDQPSTSTGITNSASGRPVRLKKKKQPRQPTIGAKTTTQTKRTITSTFTPVLAGTSQITVWDMTSFSN